MKSYSLFPKYLPLNVFFSWFEVRPIQEFLSFCQDYHLFNYINFLVSDWSIFILNLLPIETKFWRETSANFADISSFNVHFFQEK